MPESAERHDLDIEFCVPCDFRPQALALVREVVDGWAPSFRSIRLIPSSGGRFEVSLDGELIFSKAQTGRHAHPGEVAAALTERVGPPAVLA